MLMLCYSVRVVVTAVDEQLVSGVCNLRKPAQAELLTKQ